MLPGWRPGRRVLLLGLIAVWAGCGCSNPSPSTVPNRSGDERVEQGRRRALRFLLARQSPDGAWRSDLYGQFKDGTALTPLALQALLTFPPDAERDAALRNGATYLAELVGEDGQIAAPSGLPYPVYTAAGAVEVLSRWEPERHRRARDGWLAYLRGRQLTEQLGWQPSDWQYGGWGYCPVVPRKPKPGELAPPFLESNLSATVFALSALRTAGVSAEDLACRRARTFVERCQNFAPEGDGRDARLDDGGFFFVHGDAVRNKAGAAGKDADGRERFRSYGSATADGLRGLLLCGVPPDHVRVAQARAWLTADFGADRHPGSYDTSREAGRQAVYFYFHHSASQAFSALALEEIDSGGRKVRWREAVAAELLARQRQDGSWSNAVLLTQEDEPLVATSFAVLTLAAR